MIPLNCAIRYGYRQQTITINVPGLKVFNILQCQSKLFIEFFHSCAELGGVDGLAVLGALEDALEDVVRALSHRLHRHGLPEERLATVKLRLEVFERS